MKLYLSGTAFGAFCTWWTKSRLKEEASLPIRAHDGVWSHFQDSHGGVGTLYDGVVDKTALYDAIRAFSTESYAAVQGGEGGETSPNILAVSGMVQAAHVWHAAFTKRQNEAEDLRRIKASEEAAEHRRRGPASKFEVKLVARAMMATGDRGKGDGELTENELRTYIGVI